MVSQVTSMSRNGVSDWLVQRVSALVLAAYTLCIFGFVVINPGLDFETWSGFFNTTGMQIFTMLAILCACLDRYVDHRI
jgi:succinate dehydrogenase / fumarate reductase, membrane anchor subunit